MSDQEIRERLAQKCKQFCQERDETIELLYKAKNSIVSTLAAQDQRDAAMRDEAKLLNGVDEDDDELDDDDDEFDSDLDDDDDFDSDLDFDDEDDCDVCPDCDEEDCDGDCEEDDDEDDDDPLADDDD